MKKNNLNQNGLILLIENSTLSKRRREYWINKVNNKDFQQSDLDKFVNDLEESLALAKTELFDLKSEIEQLAQKNFENKRTVLEELKKAVNKQPKVLDKQFKELKIKISEVEQQALASYQKYQNDKKATEISKIRSKIAD
jgi:hypothetical protein